MERPCHEYLENLETVLGNEEKKGSSLPPPPPHLSNLNAANILVRPGTLEITGIVDWEMTNVAPEWKTTARPKFLQNMEPEDEEKPPIPSYEDESDIAVYTRDRWDNRILRRHFNDVMKRLTWDDEVMGDTLKTKAKRECYEMIPELTDRAKEVYWKIESDNESDVEA